MLSYERFAKNMEDEPDPDVDENISEDKTASGTNGVKTCDIVKEDFESDSVKPEEMEELNETKEEKDESVVANSKEKENFTPKIGIKPLQLLTEPKVADNLRAEEDVKLKIDDLIIIPNNNYQKRNKLYLNIFK